MPTLAPEWPVNRVLFHHRTHPDEITYEATTGPTERIGQVAFTKTRANGKTEQIIGVFVDGHWHKPYSTPRPPRFPRGMVLEVEAAIAKIQADMLTTAPF